jgi:hypothetical protein
VVLPQKSDTSHLPTGGRLQFADGFLQGVGGPASEQNLTFMNAWMIAESGADTGSPTLSGCAYNPLNTTQSEPGSSQCPLVTTVPVQAYTTLQYGIDGNVTTAVNGDYNDNILPPVRNGSCAVNDAQGVADSPWGTGTGVLSVLAEWGITSCPPASEFTGDVTYAPGVNGSLQEVFAHSSDGTVYESWEDSAGQWSRWASLGGDIISNLTYAPGPGAPGSVQELFGIGADHQAFEDWQDSTGHWNGWVPRGGTSAGELTGDLSYGPGTNSSVQELFGRNTNGTVYEMWEDASLKWSLWNSRGGTMASDITVAPGSGGSVQELWARNSLDTIFEAWENSSGQWSTWRSRGAGLTSNLTYAPGSQGSLQEIWGVKSASGNVFEMWENYPSLAWSPLTDRGGVMTGDVTYAPGTGSAAQEIWARNTNGTVFENWETSTWNGWVSRGGDITSDLTYAPGSNGSAQEIFGLSPTGGVEEIWENSAGQWSTWANLGS